MPASSSTAAPATVTVHAIERNRTTGIMTDWLPRLAGLEPER